MPTDDRDVTALARRVRVALESADVSQFAELLDPNVRWGSPDDPTPSCRSRSDVLEWYGQRRVAGRRARVVDVRAHADKILVHLVVAMPAPNGGRTVESPRWQVLTCARGRVVDVRSFESGEEALARVALSR